MRPRPRVLGAVHRGVGVAQQLLGVVRCRRRAARCRRWRDHRDVVAADANGLGRAPRAAARRSSSASSLAGDVLAAARRTRRRRDGRRCRPGRSASSMRAAIVRSTLVAGLVTEVSLIALKRSRSRKSTAIVLSLRSERCSAWRRRSSSSARLGSPVSASCSARCCVRSRSSRCLERGERLVGEQAQRLQLRAAGTRRSAGSSAQIRPRSSPSRPRSGTSSQWRVPGVAARAR